MLITDDICRMLATLQVLVIYSSISYLKSKRKSKTYVLFTIFYDHGNYVSRLQARTEISPLKSSGYFMHHQV
jgi:hypothetical protein